MVDPKFQYSIEKVRVVLPIDYVTASHVIQGRRGQ
jgi:hypothetical protein